MRPGLTEFQTRVLRALCLGPRHPEELYRHIWPTGRYFERNPGSAGGGPSRGATAVNWHLGKMQRAGLVERPGQGNAKWKITTKGKEQLGDK